MSDTSMTDALEGVAMAAQILHINSAPVTEDNRMVTELDWKSLGDALVVLGKIRKSDREAAHVARQAARDTQRQKELDDAPQARLVA